MKKKIAAIALGIMIAGSAIVGSIYAAGAIKLIVNGQAVKTDVSPFMTKERVMVPIRFVSEALGYNIQWDESKQQVTIDHEIWKETIPEEDKGTLRAASNTVSSYLVLLQSRYDPSLNNPDEYIKFTTGENEIFMPSYGGSSLNYIANYEILDGRLLKSAQGDTAEIAASYWLLSTTESRYTKYTIIYTLKQQDVNGVQHWLIDTERTLKTEAFKEKPAQLHAPFEINNYK
ncbi:hypothetical protein PA598K_05263 [Paenibacillus sp. 598K]|uniref:copper amine oxidase N-terminal domain-containing protein n=1 Tax=Paenibacillus sp. 598K TaxID=1117987 RepID=UPI000FF956FA|nr:copper amine oxidase N-terminal domain-containing protein [Paenibacillus sp. 598K]GBF76776.1 hypothetical protein PA598K_05263 [Paenibacillus sp. 598K]